MIGHRICQKNFTIPVSVMEAHLKSAVIVAAFPLAYLTILYSPGNWAVGSTATRTDQFAPAITQSTLSSGHTAPTQIIVTY